MRCRLYRRLGGVEQVTQPGGVEANAESAHGLGGGAERAGILTAQDLVQARRDQGKFSRVSVLFGDARSHLAHPRIGIQ